MLSWLIRNRLDAFEKKYDYDVSYMRDMLATDRKAVMALMKVSGFGAYRRDIPKDVLWAARIVAMVSEDCGPCTQLSVAMALEDGATPRVIADVLAARDAALPEPVRLGVQFTRAALAHDPAADPLREDILRRWGPRALISLAYGMTASRIYPTIKYALGHGKACQRVKVAGEHIAVSREAVAQGVA